MNIRQLNYLIAIAEEKNLSRAAEISYISQSALSQYLIRLERELGISLFERHKSEWIPTAAGKVYIDAARQITAMHEKALVQIEQLMMEKNKALVFGCSPERIPILMPEVYHKFGQKYHDIDIRVVEGTHDQLQKLVMDGTIDLCLTRFPLDAPSEYRFELDGFPLVREELVWAIPRNHPLAKNSQVTLFQMAAEEQITHRAGKTLRKITDSLFANAELHYRIVVEVNSTRTAVELVAQGMGVALVPRTLGQQNEQVVLLPMTQPVWWELGICYRKGKKMSSPEQYLIGLLQQMMMGEEKN